jgi:hypothetical protein
LSRAPSPRPLDALNNQSNHSLPPRHCLTPRACARSGGIDVGSILFFLGGFLSYFNYVTMTLMAEKTTSTGYFSKISTEEFARKQVRGFVCVCRCRAPTPKRLTRAPPCPR